MWNSELWPVCLSVKALTQHQFIHFPHDIIYFIHRSMKHWVVLCLWLMILNIIEVSQQLSNEGIVLLGYHLFFSFNLYNCIFIKLEVFFLLGVEFMQLFFHFTQLTPYIFYILLMLFWFDVEFIRFFLLNDELLLEVIPCLVCFYQSLFQTFYFVPLFIDFGLCV